MGGKEPRPRRAGAESRETRGSCGLHGVANGLQPHMHELGARPGDPAACEPITELAESQEAARRRRHKTAREAVWRELGAMGVIYQRGQVFPCLPAWLDPNGDDA